jgi:hypothetical protein
MLDRNLSGIYREHKEGLMQYRDFLDKRLRTHKEDYKNNLHVAVTLTVAESAMVGSFAIAVQSMSAPITPVNQVVGVVVLVVICSMALLATIFALKARAADRRYKDVYLACEGSLPPESPDSLWKSLKSLPFATTA